jgi:hypothetical protein
MVSLFFLLDEEGYSVLAYIPLNCTASNRMLGLLQAA